MCAHIGVVLAQKKIKRTPLYLDPPSVFEKYFPVSVGTHLVCLSTIRPSAISSVQGFL
jgi:hypothetical protein